MVFIHKVILVCATKNHMGLNNLWGRYCYFTYLHKTDIGQVI